MSGGTVGHSGFLSHAELFGLVEATTDVTALRLIDREKKLHQVALSFQARTVGGANWLQFLGPSVVGVFSRGRERLVGELAFNEGRVKVTTTLSPGDTPYFLDSEDDPFANRPETTLCEKLLSGQEKITFFDQPIADNVAIQLTPFSQSIADKIAKGHPLEKRRGLPLSLILIAEFYSYLVLEEKTPLPTARGFFGSAVYLIRWQVENEVVVGPSGGVVPDDPGDELGQAHRQFVLDTECGPVGGLAGEHHAILQKAFPNANVR